MGMETLIGGAVSLVGGMMNKGAAEDAASAQTAAADKADATQRYMYDTTRADNLPYMQRGNAAGNALAYRLGLGGSANGGVGSSAPAQTRDDLRNQLLGKYTTKTTNPIGMTEAQKLELDAVFGGRTWDQPGLLFNPSSTSSSVDETGLNAEIDRRLAEQAQFQSQASSSQQNDPLYGSLLRKFGQSDLDSDLVYQNGLQFSLDEGRKAINKQAAATGGMLSGDTLKALTKYGNNFATTRTGDSYSRFMNDKSSVYNMLAGVAGTGQVANSQVGQSGMNAANQMSANQIGAGNARGASAIAQGNALSGGLSGAFNTYQQGNMMNRLFPNGGGFGGGFNGFDGANEFSSDYTYGMGRN
jgi:hypothetical protein